jgi:hypothetical protein
MIRLAIDGRSASRSTGGRQLDSVLPHDHVPCWDGGWLAGNGPTHTSRPVRCFRRSRCPRGNRPCVPLAVAVLCNARFPLRRGDRADGVELRDPVPGPVEVGVLRRGAVRPVGAAVSQVRD